MFYVGATMVAYWLFWKLKKEITKHLQSKYNDFVEDFN